MVKIRKKDIVSIVLYALPNTILSFVIVYIINNVLSGNEEFHKGYIGISFTALVIYTYLLNIIFQKKLNKFSFELLYENEKKIFNQVLKAPMLSLEKFGPKRFLTAVEDLRVFSSLPFTVTHTVNSILMLVLCLVYMFTLSVYSAIVVIGLIVLLAGCYFLVVNSMSKKVSELRKYNENYYQYAGDLMDGFKELKLSFFRRDNLMNKFLIPNRDEARDLDFQVNYVFLSINLISQYGLYIIVATVLFLLPQLGLLDRENIIAYVMIIMFISGPINNLINLQQTYTRFIVANMRLKNFLKDFKLLEDKKETCKNEIEKFQTIKYENVYFDYNDEENENTFALGPINLEIKSGETIFIVGGNGSGKSTFINTLTGIYEPTKGDIILNDNLENSTLDLQNLIAAVFTENHIFSHNYDNYRLEDNSEYKEWLMKMELDKIILDDKESSARRKFSKGQSKRISMIFALLEAKPILVLDEWAADQDPYFRKYFYEDLLPLFKSMGKTIIAVTHDDAYFEVADRILKFDYGMIVKDIEVNANIKAELNQNVWIN